MGVLQSLDVGAIKAEEQPQQQETTTEASTPVSHQPHHPSDGRGTGSGYLAVCTDRNEFQTT